jgi:hypothetical protein
VSKDSREAAYEKAALQDLTQRVSRLLVDLGGFSRGRAETSARLLAALLSHKSGTPADLARWAEIPEGGAVSTCLSDLHEMGLISRETLGHERARIVKEETQMDRTPRVVYVDSDLPTSLSKWAERQMALRRSTSEEDLAEVMGRLRSPNPVIMIETIVSSRKPGERLQPADYTEAVNRTMNLYRNARRKIKILTGDFDWIESPMPAIQTALGRRGLEVQLLVDWKRLAPDAQAELLKLMRRNERFQVKDLRSPEVFRMSMVDDEYAVVVKKSVEPKITVKIEGAFQVNDREFVSIILEQFFDSRWKSSGKAGP